VTARATRVVVRRATARDVDAIVTLRGALLKMSRGNPAYRRLRADHVTRAGPRFAAQLVDDRCLTLVACIGRDCVGMLRCAFSAPNPLYSPPRHAYLMSVYVRPAYRRRGVVRALLRHAERWCARHGVNEMRLHCGIENAAANATWRALGFEPAETLYVRRVAAVRPARG
jgi:ribosomal protein S18 acetylase RimI-like enzyme